LALPRKEPATDRTRAFGSCTNPTGRALGLVRMRPDVGGVRANHHSVLCVGHAWSMPDVVNQLLATEVALDKLGARGSPVPRPSRRSGIVTW